MLASEMVSAVKTQAAFDTSGSNVTDATVLSWLNFKYRDFCVQAGWFKEIIEIGPTVANVATYTIPAAVSEIKAMQIGGQPEALRVSVEQMWALRSASAWLTEPVNGAYAPSFDAAGAQAVGIFPTPTAAGTSLQALVISMPADLTTSPDTTPVIPLDFHEQIVNGAIAMGYLRTDARADLAAPYDAMFEAALQRLKRRAIVRVGQGPVQFPVRGTHFS